MTTTTTWSIDGTTTPATVARRMLAGLVGTPGVDAAGALAVSERAAGANNSWDIAAGGAFFLVGGEVWHAWWDDTNVPATAADGTSDRIDLIVAELRADAVNNDAVVRVVTGTPGDTNEPAVPAGAVVLARADVPKTVGSMVDGYLTDRRTSAVGNSAIHDGLHTSAGTAGVVVGTAENTTVTNHGTASRTISGTINIPAGWNDYTLVLEASYALKSTSATVRRMDHLLTYAGLSASNRSKRVEQGNTATFDDTVHQVRRWTGQAATGAQTFSTTLALNAVDSAVSTDEVTLVATAIRTS